MVLLNHKSPIQNLILTGQTISGLTIVKQWGGFNLKKLLPTVYLTLRGDGQTADFFFSVLAGEKKHYTPTQRDNDAKEGSSIQIMSSLFYVI